ncbi:hypothetical protein [Nocardia sp. NPDC020380]|uniref:hypothetical protein n=1 Tax=Nocardia sp. NPDC020380 TaxID=3364309 RepID=UPI0037AFEA3F
MCRATGELGDAERFDIALHAYRDLLDQNTGSGMLFQPFTLREIELRGLMGTGRVEEACQIVYRQAGRPAAPQWYIIERVTTGEVLAANQDIEGAADAFADAIESAERHRLPHQIQRAVRATAKAGMRDLADEAKSALQRTRSTLSTR